MLDWGYIGTRWSWSLRVLIIHLVSNVLMDYSCSVAKSCPTRCDPMNCSLPSLSFSLSLSLLKLTSIESMMLSSHVIICHSLLLPSVFPSVRVFSNESTLHIRWPKYWSFSFSISPSNEYSELISFRIDWFNPLAVWGTPKSLLQHQSLKASLLWHLAFFMVHLSRPWLLEKP